MQQFEQDWLELGSRVARSLHYQHPRNLRLLHPAQAEGRTTAPHAQERIQSERRSQCPSGGRVRPTTPEEVMPPTPSSIP
jgi:hypothetical protein